MGKQYLSSTRNIKVDVKALEPGMFVCDLDRPWTDTPFLIQGFLLANPEDVKAVQDICDYVYIDLARGASKDVDQPSQTRREYVCETAVEDEIENAFDKHQRTHALVKSTMDDIRFGNVINTTAIKEVVSDCVESVLRNPNAMLLLTQIKNKDEYTSQHSLNVCILTVALGRHLGLAVKELEELGLCGLLHDMGKMKTPIEILNKEGKLTPEEFEIMKRHTRDGMEILMSARGIVPSVVDVAYSHHERMDGSGYPRGLSAEGITPFSRKVAIVDTYDAITSDRVYQNGRSHLEALNILTKSQGSHFDTALVINFLACVGVYPPGSIVELATGEVGIVIEVTPETKTKPKLLMVLDNNKKPCRERTLDLSERSDHGNEAYQIREVLRQRAYGIDLRKYLEKGLLIKGSSSK